MFTKELLEYKDIFKDDDFGVELKGTGDWISAYVDPLIAWPVRLQKIDYQSSTYWILPVTKDARLAVVVRVGAEGAAKARENISRFLSVLSWIYDSSVVIESFGGGNRLYPYMKSSNNSLTVCNALDLRYLPDVVDQKSRLALALMREGRGLRHPAYSFLSFWRVLEVAVGGSDKIKAWISTAVGGLDNRYAKESLLEMNNSGIVDVAHHLYVSGRCAISHAKNNPIVDPDQPEDTRRLYQERPIVEALAALAIEDFLSIKTSYTVHNEHLYELAGFRRLLAADIIEKITTQTLTVADGPVNLPMIDFNLYGKPSFKSLTELTPVELGIEQGCAKITFGRPDGRLQVVVLLDFKNERLLFDIYNGFYISVDDGTHEYSAIQADIQEFTKWYFLNGCLEIRESVTQEEISRKDAYIPINVMVNPEVFDMEITRLREEVSRRLELAKE
jgi:hypothetical protein